METNEGCQGIRLAYETRWGKMYQGKVEDFLVSRSGQRYEGRVQLVFTSPPFPLNTKKKYGNQQGDAYITWLASFAKAFRSLLRPDGSLVMELGNAWVKGDPVMSPLALKALLQFLEVGDFKLCQQFVCYNPTRLPTPAQWVNIERIRVKDAYTHLWWMSPIARPKANNRWVLKDYSSAMTKLLRKQKYNAGRRPSGHYIGEKSFLKNNGGAIPSNVITLTNTHSSGSYLQFCRNHGLPQHPARMPIGLPEFFIKFLTEEDDIVLDPFAGSNTTGAVAEGLKRRWVGIEPRDDYIAGSLGRFPRLWEGDK